VQTFLLRRKKKTVNGIIYREVLELWLLSQLLQDKPDVVFQHDLHHISTIRWQNSWTGSCLSDGLAEGPHFLAFAISRSEQIWPPQLFPLGVCERWGLRSANAYNPEQLEGSNTNNDCKNWWAFIAKYLARSRILSWCVQGNKWSTFLNFRRE
jgi:hypothetical protein